jgi:hypothetical protein
VSSRTVVTLYPRAESDRFDSPREQDVHDLVRDLSWRAARQDQAQASVEGGRRLFAENGDVPDSIQLKAERRQVTTFGVEERRLSPGVNTTGERFGSIASGEAIGSSIVVFLRVTAIMLRMRHIGEL